VIRNTLAPQVGRPEAGLLRGRTSDECANPDLMRFAHSPLVPAAPAALRRPAAPRRCNSV